jgi:hypothetical protein
MTLAPAQSESMVLASVLLRPACHSKAAGKIKKILSSFDRIAMMRLHLSVPGFVASTTRLKWIIEVDPADQGSMWTNGPFP